jgi:hypothetical protein
MFHFVGRKPKELVKSLFQHGVLRIPCRAQISLAITVARLVCLPRAPPPAATGGGFGFGKIRRDEQGCLVQKFVAAPHGLADGAFAEVEGPDHFI